MPIRRNASPQPPFTAEQQEAAAKAHADWQQKIQELRDRPAQWCGAVHDEESGRRWACTREPGHDGEHRAHKSNGDFIAARWDR